MGESGSGKTTLSRIILNLTNADSGRVTFNGQDIFTLPDEAMPSYRRNAQMVYQNPFASLDTRFSIREILQEPLDIHRIGGKTERLARVRRMMDQVHLPSSFLSRRPGELSGGQRQRVAIARAIITEPRMVILDEAVSALDVSVQAGILTLLKEIQQEYALAYLFITHNLSVARRFSDVAYVMKAGRIVESGSTSTLFDHPEHHYTQRLVAAIPGQLALGKNSVSIYR